MLILFYRISYFLVRTSLDSSRSLFSEFRNFYFDWYSYFRESYSANRLVLKSAKSFADFISYSSRLFMASRS
jgi:hypothetical protein